MGVAKAEWTKLRSIRGWVFALAAGAALMTGLGLATGVAGSCDSGCVLPTGPEGQEVTDAFTFAHQTVTGDGRITVCVSSLTGERFDGQPGVAPWAKAGLIVKDGTRPGSAYAAVMLTGANGVRVQHNYVHDKAGLPGNGPRWLRLTRSGSTVTGEESSDGTKWTVGGTVELQGFPATAEVGMFVTSPQHAEAVGGGASGGPTTAGAVFEQAALTGGWHGTQWNTTTIGAPANEPPRGGAQSGGGRITLTGSGDIAPAVAGAAGIGVSMTQTLVGTFAALIVAVVIGAMFATAEYRRGLIHLTLAATPRRGRVLAAKASVLGTVVFGTGLAAAALVVGFGPGIMRGNGAYVHPAPTETLVRLVFGTAALLATAAVLALALGILLRRGVVAVTAAIVTIVLPYLLAVSVLSPGAARWLLTFAPAAGFAVQQSAARYDHVANLYLVADGYFPLPPWAGFGVLVAWTVAALAAAARRLTRSDA